MKIKKLEQNCNKMIYYYCDLGNTNVTENQIESVFHNIKYQKTIFCFFCTSIFQVT